MSAVAKTSDAPKLQEDIASKSLEGLNEDALKYLQETLKHIIDQAAGRIHYAESRRSTFVLMGGALFAGSAALIALDLPNVHYFPARMALVYAGFIGLVTSALIWILYARQTNFYPFTKVTKTWKWFYRDALSNSKAFDAPWHTLWVKEPLRRNREVFNMQWSEFPQRIVQLKDRKVSVSQDIQQIYVLHVNELYKNLFLTHLQRVISRGLLAAVGIGVIVFVATALFIKSPPLVAYGANTKGPVTVKSSWRETGEARVTGIGGQELQLLLNLRIRNAGNTKITNSVLIPRDGLGLQLPVSVQSITPNPLILAPNATVTGVALVWIPSPLVTQIHHFEIIP